MLNINEVLNNLWGTVIEKFYIDMMKHEIELKVKSCENGVETNIDIVIKDVIAFCWINDSFHQDKDRLDLEKWNFISLESTRILNDSLIKIKIEEIENFAKPNILLELWSSNLLVEAKSIAINDKLFELIRD